LQQWINGEIKRCFANGRDRVLKGLELMDAAIENVHPIVEKLSPADIGNRKSGTDQNFYT